MDADIAYLMDNPRLFRAVLDFNRCDRSPDFALPDTDAQTVRLRAALAAQPRLWRRFRREQTNVWCFSALENRLALLPLAALERLATYWSAVVLAEVLARTVDGECLQRFKAAIGQEAFHYAMRQGRFRLGGLRAAWLPADAEHLSDRVLQSPGRKLFQLCLSLWPEDLRAVWLDRWRSAPVMETFSLSVAEAEKDPALWKKTWPSLAKLLFTEVAPEWQPCFNS